MVFYLDSAGAEIARVHVWTLPDGTRTRHDPKRLVVNGIVYQVPQPPPADPLANPSLFARAVASCRLQVMRIWGPIRPTFRTSRTRYRAKGAVGFSERELLHPAHQALELLVVAEPLPA